MKSNYNFAVVKTNRARSKFFPVKNPELVLQGGSTFCEIALRFEIDLDDDEVYEDEVIIQNIEMKSVVANCFDEVVAEFFKEIEDFKKEFDIEEILINWYAIWISINTGVDQGVELIENYAKKVEIPTKVINVRDDR